MKVSIIIPLYNKAPYVTKALESVKAQTFWAIGEGQEAIGEGQEARGECLIIDDGSTDNSASIVDQWINASRPSSIAFRLISQANAGVSAARNYGIAEAQGEYLAFLDADDWWALEYLEEMMKLVEEYPEAGIYGCNYWYVRRGKSTVRLDYPTGYMDYFKVYADTGNMPLWTGAVVMKKAIAQEFGGFPIGMILGEDTYLWMQVVLKYGMAWLNTPLAYYNNDVLQETRGIVKDKIYKPETFLTFRLDKFEEVESTNPNVKRLFDRMRVYSLERYLEQNAYPELVAKEIAKVEWNNVDRKYWWMYNMPYPLVKSYFVLFRAAYNIYCKFRGK